MKPRTKKIIFWTIGILILIGIGGVSLAFGLIHHSLKESIEIAQKPHPHPGNDVLSLIDYINSDLHSLQEKNNKVWALGRIGDPKSLPALNSHYTGQICDHNKNLCQYELEKAIKWCGETPNPTRKTKG